MGLIDFSLDDIGGIFKDIREAITGEAIKDPTKIAEIEYKLDELENKLKLGQITINKAEATNPNVFVAGWRPFIGWVGGFALAYNFIVQPTIIWYANFHNINIGTPTLDTGTLMTLVLAMLGIGGMRSFDKIKGVDTKRISPIKPA